MSLNIQMLDPKTLVPFEGNSKEHPEEQVDAIASSLKNFGFDQAVVVDKSLVIIKGHGRVLAAIKLGMKTVPVVVKEESSDPENRMNRILDNHLVSPDYDPYALNADLTFLKGKGMVEKALFTESMIPEVTQAIAKTEASLLSLVTKHKCPTCEYRW